MAKSKLFPIAFFVLLSSWVSSLEVSPNSPCWQKCLDDPKNGDKGNRSHSLTFHDNLACFDDEYVGENTTKVAKKFAECQGCMGSSGYEDPEFGERDTHWFMFNNKATVDWCIFGRFAEEKNDKVSDTYPYRTCNTQCQSIYTAIDYNIKSDAVTYNFCDTDGNFTEMAESCRSCLYNATSLTILGNILTTVQELCRQKPGKIFTFDADIYAASPIALSSATTGVSSTPATSTLPGTNSPSPNGNSSSLSGGVIAGIVLGALVGIALVLVGVLLVLRRLRKGRENIQMPKEMPPNQVMGGDYQYDPMQRGKDGYVYQHGHPPLPHEGPAELIANHGVNELPVGPTSPTGPRRV